VSVVEFFIEYYTGYYMPKLLKILKALLTNSLHDLAIFFE